MTTSQQIDTDTPPEPAPGTAMGSAAASGPSLFVAVRGRVAIIIGLAMLGAASSVVPFIAIIELARTLLGRPDGAPVDSHRVWAIVIVAVVALLISFASGFGSAMIGHLADADLQNSLRQRIIAHLQRLPLGWFDQRSSGVARKLVENDVVALHQLVAHAIQDCVIAITVPLISLVYLFTVNWPMALATLVPVVLILAMYPLMMRDAEQKYAEYDRATQTLAGATVEFVQGIAVVKRFGQVGRSHRRYREATREYSRFVDEWTRATAVAFTIVEIISSPVVVLAWLLGVATWLVANTGATPLDVLPGLLLGLGLTAPFLKLGASGQLLRNASQAYRALVGFFAIPTITQPDEPQRPSGGAVDLTDVCFSYDGQHQVLHQIAAHCAPGTVTALVGASGSGKSTLAKLVPRFYDVDQGQVAIGGADVRELASEQLYDQVGFVFQDVQLLRASVRDNIALARPDATDAEIEQAARAAQIHDRIQRLERGYDSVVGQDANLSGGEAQRVTIARALLADAPVLVLDEATAFADPDSEAAIQRALSTLASERTVLVVAHRLHTIIGADRILVLDGGRIIEAGTHDELVARGGRYAQMWADYQANHARTLAQTFPEGVHA